MQAGDMMAYSLSSGGSDWCKIHVSLPDGLRDAID